MKGLGGLPFHLLRPRPCADAIEGWLAYGAALNEGRALFHPEDDKGFGKWKAENVLSQVGIVKPKADEEIAAMWAAHGWWATTTTPVERMPASSQPAFG